MRFRQQVAAIFIWVSCCGLLAAEDFSVRLQLKNAHLREIFFGSAAKGTAGYDRALDAFAPPPGIATGYVGFIPGTPNLPLFYKDIRSLDSEQTWQLYTKVYKGKPMLIQWDPASLPQGWSFTLKSKEATLDMQKTKMLELRTSQTVTISGKRNSATKKNTMSIEAFGCRGTGEVKCQEVDTLTQ